MPQRSQKLLFRQMLLRACHRHVFQQHSQRFLQYLGEQYPVRRAHRALRGIAAIHFPQTPVLVRSLAVMQPAHVGKSAEHSRDST